MNKYKVHDQEFEELNEAYEYCVENDISVEEIVQLEEAPSIDDTPETLPDEGSAVPEYVINPQNLTEKKERLQWVLGGRKERPKPVKTGEAIKEHYRGILDKVTHPKTTTCPLCGEYLGKLSKDELGLLVTFENLTYQVPKTFVRHAKSQHISVYKMMDVLKEFTHPREKGDEEAQTGPLMKHQVGAPNPEQCNLSEDLSEEPDSQRFIENLSKKVKEGFELTPEERKRLLVLWKLSRETN